MQTQHICTGRRDSSIVELSQAQLQQTQAQIQYAAATYQYRIAQAVLRFEIASP